MIRPRPALVAMAALSMTAACGGPNANPPGGGGGGAAAAALLAEAQGTWAAPCAVTSTGSEIFSLVVSNTTFAASMTTYGNGTCSGTGTTTLISSGTSTIGAAVTVSLGTALVTAYPLDSTSLGVTRYDLIYIDTTVTPNRLYLGLKTVALDGSTAAKRPTALDPSSWVARQ